MSRSAKAYLDDWMREIDREPATLPKQENHKPENCKEEERNGNRSKSQA